MREHLGAADRESRLTQLLRSSAIPGLSYIFFCLHRHPAGRQAPSMAWPAASLPPPAGVRASMPSQPASRATAAVIATAPGPPLPTPSRSCRRPSGGFRGSASVPPGGRPAKPRFNICPGCVPAAALFGQDAQPCRHATSSHANAGVATAHVPTRAPGLGGHHRRIAAPGLGGRSRRLAAPGLGGAGGVRGSLLFS